MKIIIVEDEPAAIRHLKRMILKILPDAKIVAELDSVETAVGWFNKNELPDLAFFDIQLSDGLSFEIFENVAVKCPIVFTTAFDHYAIQAFKVNSIDYLLKPIKPEELQKAIEKFQNLQYEPNQLNDLTALLQNIKASSPSYKERFLVKKGQQLLSIDAKNIAYVFSEDKITFLQTTSAKYLINYSLDDLEFKLSPKDFFRLNRKCIAAYSSIQKIEKYFNGKLLVELHPSYKDKIVVSREKASLFKEWLNN